MDREQIAKELDELDCGSVACNVDGWCVVEPCDVWTNAIADYVISEVKKAESRGYYRGYEQSIKDESEGNLNI